jgi:hypothetical protein
MAPATVSHAGSIARRPRNSAYTEMLTAAHTPKVACLLLVIDSDAEQPQ